MALRATADKVFTAANWVLKEVEARGHTAHLIDPLVYDLPLLRQMYKVMENPSPKFTELHDKLAIAADGFILVSGEYNHGPPPALKNLLDHFQQEFFL